MEYFCKIVPTYVYTAKGMKYSVWLFDKSNSVLLCSSFDPEYDSCRKLLELGYKGRVYFYRKSKTNWDSSLNIETGAKYSIRDTSKMNLTIVKYKPLPEGTF